MVEGEEEVLGGGTEGTRDLVQTHFGIGRGGGWCKSGA